MTSSSSKSDINYVLRNRKNGRYYSYRSLQSSFRVPSTYKIHVTSKLEKANSDFSRQDAARTRQRIFGMQNKKEWEIVPIRVSITTTYTTDIHSHEVQHHEF